MLTLEKIKDAQATLSNAIYKTDVIRASKLSFDYELYLKTENLQKTGSFKIRGAYYKISRLSAEEKKRFQTAVQGVYEKYCGGQMDIIDRIIAEGGVK